MTAHIGPALILYNYNIQPATLVGKWKCVLFRVAVTSSYNIITSYNVLIFTLMKVYSIPLQKIFLFHVTSIDVRMILTIQ